MKFFASIRIRLLLVLLFLQLSLFGVFYLLTSYALRESAARSLETNVAQTAEIINLALTPYAVNGELSELQDFFAELIAQSPEGMIYLQVVDEQGKPLLVAGHGPSAPLPALNPETADIIEQGVLHRRQGILLRNNQVGTVQFGLATSAADRLHEQLRTHALWLGLIVIIGLTLVAIILGRRFNRYLQEFMTNLDAIAAGHYQSRLPTTSGDELAQLAANINRMSEAVWLREQTFSSVFNAAPVAMFLVRFEPGVNSYFVENTNAAALKLFNLKADEVVGKNELELRQRVDAASRQRFLEAVENFPGLSAEVPFVDGYGKERHSLFSNQFFEVEGQHYLILALVDVSELRETQAELQKLNQQLEERVSQRTQDLHEKNTELSQTVETLHLTRDQLVQAEKLSSLGSVVAAVAHELNTPVGNALTVATTQQAQLTALQHEVKHGLTRSGLQRYLDQGNDAAVLLVRNLERAAELVASFKEVAVDRTSSQRRSFDLATVVNEIIMTLSPGLKRRHYQIEMDIAAGLICDSYPGPLGQIITNLVNNAVVHGFAERESGRIVLRAAALDQEFLRLTVSDDGGGIPLEHQAKIFDPFFTTRLGEGGSGLGLSIVYNLVTGLLGGRITVESQPEEGSQFAIDIPYSAPLNPQHTLHYLKTTA